MLGGIAAVIAIVFFFTAQKRLARGLGVVI